MGGGARRHLRVTPRDGQTDNGGCLGDVTDYVTKRVYCVVFREYLVVHSWDLSEGGGSE